MARRRVIPMLLLAAVLAGCGGRGGPATSQNPPQTPATVVTPAAVRPTVPPPDTADSTQDDGQSLSQVDDVLAQIDRSLQAADSSPSQEGG